MLEMNAEAMAARPTPAPAPGKATISTPRTTSAHEHSRAAPSAGSRRHRAAAGGLLDSPAHEAGPAHATHGAL